MKTVYCVDCGLGWTSEDSSTDDLCRNCERIREELEAAVKAEENDDATVV